MKKQVAFNRDITPILPVMVGVYEKANIYEPYTSTSEAVNILCEEYEEVKRELDGVYIEINDGMKKEDLLNVKHKAFSCIFELLQVIAVSNKYLQLLEKEEKGIANENKEDVF